MNNNYPIDTFGSGTVALRWIFLLFAVVAFVNVQANDEQSDGTDNTSQAHSSRTPDIRGSDMKIKVEKGNFVAVPIPTHTPVLDWGLVVGAAYFYKQTEEQNKAQPASVTGVAAMYTSNHSWALGIGQESYWDEDKWRFTGAIGLADLDLELLVPENTAFGSSADWLLEGGFVFAQIEREIANRWYLGVHARYIDFEQSISIGVEPVDLGLNFSDASIAAGLGISFQRDSRDMPTNPYQGSLFKVSALFNDTSFGGDDTYESYNVAFSSYHELTAPVVLAWQVTACLKNGTAPMYDACTVNLRGFSMTDYMGKESALAQFEARWKISKRWGVVGFAGVGYMNDSLSGLRDNEAIPSYGLGVRFMVMQAKRINVRVDYGRSNDSDAWYLSAGESF